MVKAVNETYSPMVEVKWNKDFVPDLCIVGEDDKIYGVLEYESTNSSDERLIYKDLSHFEKAILEYQVDFQQCPEWWLVISTLPNQVVRRWKWHGYNELATVLPSVKSRKARNSNPLAYYQDSIRSEFDSCWSRVLAQSPPQLQTNIVWANIDGKSLSVLHAVGTNSFETAISFELRLQS